jgi:hypothetical protein
MTHFLMVFVHCGGKISDVEKALGISYPTVKAKLGKLQTLLTFDSDAESEELEGPQADIMKSLSAFESGAISYEAMMKSIRKIKEKK